MNLFDYQLNAIKQLNDSIGYSIDQYETAKKRNRESTATVHFVSPTGSGKTIMSFALMDELSKEYDNLAFIWLAPNTLHVQTLEKFENYTDGQKKAFIDWINSAKTDQTKTDRIAKTLAMIQNGEKFY